MLASGMDDVLTTVRTDILGDSRHHRSQQVAGADDESELFTGVEGETDRE